MTYQERTFPPSPSTFIFSNEQLMSICETSDVIICSCPTRLAALLWEVRKFYHYTANCIERCPEEAETHQWLGEEVSQIDSLLSQTLMEFLRQKGLVNDAQQIDLDLLKQYQMQAFFNQP